MKIKVCGMREPENMLAVAASGIDFMGFIFYAPSPRYCGATLTREMIEHLPEVVEPVAVTVNMDEDSILDLASEYGFRFFQLHGNETPEFCRSLREKGYKVIKAFGIKEESDFENVKRYSGCVDYFLFDTASASRGGSGKKFDWDMLGCYSLSEPLILSGGISPDDVGEIMQINHKSFAGIDLNSRFEVAPGLKDPGAVRQFVKLMGRDDI
ncbi:phosphoribosylanthranilate isomerase [bacterium]|nr:phosphoribosylanthranilate isomerase [bacterium]